MDIEIVLHPMVWNFKLQAIGSHRVIIRINGGDLAFAGGNRRGIGAGKIIMDVVALKLPNTRHLNIIPLGIVKIVFVKPQRTQGGVGHPVELPGAI